MPSVVRLAFLGGPNGGGETKLQDRPETHVVEAGEGAKQSGDVRWSASDEGSSVPL